MQNFQDTSKIDKRLFISAFSICMTVPLMENFTFFAVLVCIYLILFYLSHFVALVFQKKHFIVLRVIIS